MKEFSHFFYDYFVKLGMTDLGAKYLNMAILVLATLLIIFVIDIIIRRILLNLFTKFSEKTKTHFDDYVVKNKVPRNVAHIIPLLIALEFVPFAFVDFPYFENIVEKGLQVFSILLTIWVIRSFVKAIRDYLNTKERLKDKPINSYVQVILIIVWSIGLLSAFALVTGIPFFKFITTLGAASAVILLIFRDTIMGFVASLQVSINDMVQIGDWITFEKFGADGDVIEINLATVKVQNFDKTITTIPTYALISDSFKNWRGMENSGGRRIKRAVVIKQSSIKYLNKEEINDLKKIEIIADYIKTRSADIDDFNSKNKVDKSVLINGRNLTNIGLFRKFVESYVERHSAINKEMMIMTRQLAPTTQGVPIEIYAFSKDKRWQNYEYIMADIFDHVIAAVPYFDLEVFELATDFSSTNS
ncbi:mechanosensitive ion channel family protein [Lutimonas saemankumensis]|uniref:mechanosensitive ion channel family protein n=1 Tax=Lutimonas saemankumensis TaxID=483016 RepID=UPI001CD50C8C|nr:mechanosensitive ion channel domain-containing protein [Lutimonas saemankumensis]MCA0931908.1 mechanosensitive ion channel family protein [Lutimonas saemankumensis]